MKYIPFNKIYKNLQQFQVIPENKTQENYIPTNIHDNKYKETKIVKKFLRWINI